MLFNSYAFIFLFVPVVVAGFFGLGRFGSRTLAFGWIILSSTVFYGIWRPLNIAIIAPSILANYGVARFIARYGEERPRWALSLLLAGIGGNIGFLGYFKYRNFFIDTVDGLFGFHLPLNHLILPLGISFITFQKIAFLVDVYSGRVQAFGFIRYLLFVMFFPQLVAGPIVHYREMMPQFERISLRPNATDLAVAVTLFSFGLFKKVVIADSIAQYASPVFGAAAAGVPQTLFAAWGGALAYSFQIYFDFSGYSDMALGLGRIFGIRLPLNFNSPFKAASIIELWSRWHVSLTRFLTAYLYTPIVISLTRRRQAKGMPVVAGRRTTASAFLALLAGPTILTMGISGLWHGAGFQFIVWGLLHGVFLTVNHAWRLVRPRFWSDQRSYDRMMKPFGVALTFLCFVVAIVFFRANSVATAMQMLEGMAGLNGVALPMAVGERLGDLALWLRQFGVTFAWTSGHDFMMTYLWIAALLAASLLLPNSLEMLAEYEPALGFPAPDPTVPQSRLLGWITGGSLRWNPEWRWAVGMAGISVIAVLGLQRVSEFLYWQF
jgi:D-alanyl-lipoteichoic acid acyltransferase DltB (MBOAT superfamily)